MSGVVRVAGILGCLALGALTGLVGAFLQSARALTPTPWGQVAVPWGAVLALIALVVLVRGGTWAMRSRWGGWAVVVGWIAATVAMAAESPSGDVALSGGGRQMTYLVVGVILSSAAATLPLPRVRDVNPSPTRGGTPSEDLSSH